MFPGISHEKEARSRTSPPAAGRFCDKILFRRMAILAERFYVIGRTFLWHKKTSFRIISCKIILKDVFLFVIVAVV